MVDTETFGTKQNANGKNGCPIAPINIRGAPVSLASMSVEPPPRIMR